jgi:DNA repair and recombination protein RAD52
LEQGNNLVVVGEDIFNKKDSIKACGFFWDASRKVWYMPKQGQEAA